jgi:hypothetical protein
VDQRTDLADGAISGTDRIIIELIEQPDPAPPIVAINWPVHPSVIDPEHFRDTAAVIVKLFSEAHVTLARIKARRYR